MKYISVIIDQINHHHCHDSLQHRLKLVERNVYFDIKLRFCSRKSTDYQKKIFQYLKMYQVQRSQNCHVHNISIRYRCLTVGAI